MLLKYCNELEKGTAVHFKDSFGWWREGTFIRMIEVTLFGRMDGSDLFKGLDHFTKKMQNGRKTKMAMIEFVDDNGKKQIEEVKPKHIMRSLTILKKS